MKKTKTKAIVLACVVVVLVPVAASLRGSSISQAAYSLIEQAGAALTARPILNFPSNMTCVDNAGANRTDCTPSGGGGTFYQTVQNGGVALTQRPTLNFTTNITCVDDAGNTRTNCSSAGGGGGATSSRGTFASRGACAAGQTGNTYYSTDIPVESQCNGSTWADWAFGRQVTLPASTTFTNFNIGASVVTTNGLMNLSVAAHAGDNLVGQQVVLPATPFTLDAAFAPNVLTQNNYIYGIGVTDGTKLVTFGFFNQSTPQILVSNWTNATTFSSNPIAQISNFNGSSLFHLRWADGGTNVTFSWSTDGVFFQTLGTLGRTAFLTPTNLMWFVDVNNASFGMNLTAFNWFVH